MNKQDIFIGLVSILQEYDNVNLEGVDLYNISLEELELDSLDSAEILVKLEDMYQVSVQGGLYYLMNLSLETITNMVYDLCVRKNQQRA